VEKNFSADEYAAWLFRRSMIGIAAWIVAAFLFVILAD
jgi:uncharacterized membrane protein YhdT